MKVKAKVLISFNKTFEQSSNINFAPDVPVQVVYVSLEATLRKPVLSIQLNRVHQVSVANSLKKPSISVSLVRVHSSTINASLPKPLITFFCAYDNNVFRGIVSEVDADHKNAKNLEAVQVRSSYQDTKKLEALTCSTWKDSKVLNRVHNFALADSTRIDEHVLFRHQDGKNAELEVMSRFSQTLPVRQSTALRWQEGRGVALGISIQTDQCLIANTSFNTSWKDGKRLSKDFQSSSKQGKTLSVGFDDWFQEGKNRPGLSWLIQEPSTVPVDDIYDSNIIFIDPFLFDPHIVFGLRKQAIKTITARNYYFMLHEIQIQRVVGNKAIHVSNITINTDVDSWRLATHC